MFGGSKLMEKVSIFIVDPKVENAWIMI